MQLHKRVILKTAQIPVSFCARDQIGRLCTCMASIDILVFLLFL